MGYFLFMDHSCVNARNPFPTLAAAQESRDQSVAACKRNGIHRGGKWTITDRDGRVVEQVSM